MIHRLIALRDGQNSRINQLLPQVLSADYFELKTTEIWEVNWQLKRSDNGQTWAEIGCNYEKLKPHVQFFLDLALKSTHEPLEYILDYVCGAQPMQNGYCSPLKNYHFSDSLNRPVEYYEMLTHLSTIRDHIRNQQAQASALLTIDDYLQFINSYETAEMNLINTHPLSQNIESVQLMTAYKAKGLEFSHVFIVSMHDSVWGKKARSRTNNIALPRNLQHIRYAGSNEDEQRRLLFVAMTRAKNGQIMTSHAQSDTGKSTEPVKYMLEEAHNESRKSTVLPDKHSEVIATNFSQEENVKHVETQWFSRHIQFDATLKSLVSQRLKTYQMAPTHLGTFIDMEYGGPQQFLLNTVLRFPQAPIEDGEFGTAIHAALDYTQKKLNRGKNATLDELLSHFEEHLKQRYIPETRLDDVRARGTNALTQYFAARNELFSQVAESEVDFRSEGVLIGSAHLSGKIDRLEVVKNRKELHIVDFKTGKTHTKWEKTTKMLKYKQQLYFYKFLIEGSHSWQNYTVKSARLEFVEPNQQGKIAEPLYIDFNNDEEIELKKLIQSIWSHITQVDMPDVTNYSSDYKGTQMFIEDLTRL